MRDFDSLREQLLRAGIAPRHVRRTLAELRHHHEDLVSEERGHGVIGAAADAAARERLGSDDALAAAVLAKPGLRSMTARLPWLVFAILPPVTALLASLLLVIAILLVGVKSGAVIPDHRDIAHLVPAWYQWTTGGIMAIVNFVIPCLLGFLLAWMAQRQRMKPLWPLLGMALILLLSVHGEFHVNGKGGLTGNFGTIIPWKGPFGPGRTWACGPAAFARAEGPLDLRLFRAHPVPNGLS
jgi:hypothetical protein